MHWYRRITAAAALFTLAACQKPAPGLTAADVTAVKANYTDWAAATARMDTAAIAKLVTTDVWLTEPNIAPVAGREATVTWTKTWPKDMRQEWVIDEVAGLQDLAYSRGSVTETFTGPDGKPVTEHAICLNIHRKQADGSWQFSRASCHSVDPLPPPPAPAKKK